MGGWDASLFAIGYGPTLLESLEINLGRGRREPDHIGGVLEVFGALLEHFGAFLDTWTSLKDTLGSHPLYLERLCEIDSHFEGLRYFEFQKA